MSQLGEAPSWLMGPLAVLILLGAELNALSWASQGDGETEFPTRRRQLGDSLRLALMGLGVSLGLYAVATLWNSGSAPVFLLAAGALAGLGRIVFRVRGHSAKA